MKITLKNNIIGQLGTGLTKYLNRAFEYINKNYRSDIGFDCQKLIGNRVVVMASIPSLNDLDECENSLHGGKYALLGGTETNFFNIITPFVILRVQGKIKWQTCSDFEESHGVIRETKYINYCDLEMSSVDIVKSDYNDFIDLYRSVKEAV